MKNIITNSLAIKFYVYNLPEDVKGIYLKQRHTNDIINSDIKKFKNNLKIKIRNVTNIKLEMNYINDKKIERNF